MKVQSVYDILEKVKIVYPEYEEKTIRFLKYIYDDVYTQFIENVVKHNYYFSYFKAINDDFSNFLDGDQSLLSYFSTLIFNNNKQFVTKFFDISDNYFKIIDNGLYRKDDFNPVTLTFNFYMILKLCHVYKNDYDSFKKVSSDFLTFIDSGALENNNYQYDVLLLGKKKQFIDRLVDMKLLTGFPFLREKLSDFVENICTTKYVDKLDGYNDALNIICDVVEFNNSGTGLEKSISIIEELFKRIDEEKDYFYSPLLLDGERFKYLNECYDKYIGNSSFMNEIISYIDGFNNELFDYLNVINGDGKDSFITCMNCVFDSDSFSEVMSKLDSLKHACDTYSINSENEDYLEDIRLLSSLKHKKVIDNKRVMYNLNCNNLIVKPDLIIERMQEIYRDVWKIISDDEDMDFEELFEESESMQEFEEEVESFISDITDINDITETPLLDEIIDDLSFKLVNSINEPVSEKNDSVGGFTKIKGIFGKNKN